MYIRKIDPWNHLCNPCYLVFENNRLSFVQKGKPDWPVDSSSTFKYTRCWESAAWSTLTLIINMGNNVFVKHIQDNKKLIWIRIVFINFYTYQRTMVSLSDLNPMSTQDDVVYVVFASWYWSHSWFGQIHSGSITYISIYEIIRNQNLPYQHICSFRVNMCIDQYQLDGCVLEPSLNCLLK